MSKHDRRAVEEGFRTGAVVVLVSTRTLSTGINLPADRVIIVDAWIGLRSNRLTETDVQQMGGRAGRPGLCARAEADAILVRDTTDWGAGMDCGWGVINLVSNLVKQGVRPRQSNALWLQVAPRDSRPLSLPASERSDATLVLACDCCVLPDARQLSRPGFPWGCV